LTYPDRTWTLRDLAKEAPVSLGMAYYAASSLIRMGFVSRNESNRLTVADPDRLIRHWAASYNYRILNEFAEYYTFDTDFDTFLSRFKKIPKQAKFALTLHAAAWLIAPYVRPTDVHVYVYPSMRKEELDALVKALSISPIERSGNVKLVTPYDEGVFYSSRLVNGIRTVSPVQLYVDLFNYPGRGEEAAQKVLEKITREWQTRVVRHQ
jgi:hypothetical protein